MLFSSHRTAVAAKGLNFTDKLHGANLTKKELGVFILKRLKKVVFSVLDRMSGTGQETISDRHGVTARELSDTLNLCLAKMSEVTGVRLGRKRNLRKEDVTQYEDIAYKLAHDYSWFLQGHNRADVFKELVSAGMEGIAQGLVKYVPTRNTKVSTFLYSRAKFAVQKQFAIIKKQFRRLGLSLDNKMKDDETTNGTDFISIMTATDEDDTEKTAEKRMHLKAVMSALKKMPEQEQTIVYMCSERKMSDVARVTGMRPQDIKNILAKVRLVAEKNISNWMIS